MLKVGAVLHQAGWHRRMFQVLSQRKPWDRAFFCPEMKRANARFWKGAYPMDNEKKIPYKIYLEESEMPQSWYNVRADMKNKPAPLLNPGTHQPMTA
jgi:hypothetical protein